MTARFEGSLVIGMMRNEMRTWREHAEKNQIRINWSCNAPGCMKSHLTWHDSQVCFDRAKKVVAETLEKSQKN